MLHCHRFGGVRVCRDQTEVGSSRGTKRALPSRSKALREEGRTLLAALAEPTNRRLLEELVEGRSRSELAARLWLSQRTLSRHLGELSELKLIERLPGRCGHKRLAYRLSPAGYEALSIAAELEALKGELAGRGIKLSCLLTALQRSNTLLVVARLILEQPRTCWELEGSLPDLSAPTLRRVLKALCESGLATAEPGPRGLRYRLTDAVVPCARLALLLARFRWRHLPEGPHQPLQGDLRGLLVLLAPLLRTPPELEGICHLIPAPAPQIAYPDVLVRISRGRVMVVPIDQPGELHARVEGSGLAYCQALLEGDPAGLWIQGERALAEGLFRASAQALKALAPPAGPGAQQGGGIRANF
jgi:DNA-binding HxlR family transcriptional regulator